MLHAKLATSKLHLPKIIMNPVRPRHPKHPPIGVNPVRPRFPKFPPIGVNPVRPRPFGFLNNIAKAVDDFCGTGPRPLPHFNRQIAVNALPPRPIGNPINPVLKGALEAAKFAG